MRALVGNSAAPDDIAILILNRHSGEAPLTTWPA
jgi:hypothetical protein